MADPLVRPQPAAREEDGHHQHPPGRSARKGRGFRTPTCQVEGCRVDLTDSKAYYSRHKVCGPHSKSPQVVVNGLHQRFCQQCSRFHLLNEFDSEKRSCRRRLAGHNERRRKPPPGSLLPSRYPRLSSSASGSGSRSAGFQIELASPYPRPQSTLWPSMVVQDSDQGTPTGKPLSWQRIPPHPPYVMFMPNLESSDLNGFPGHEIHSEVCFTGVTAESSRALSLLSNQSWDLRNQASSSLSTSNVTCYGGSCKTAEAPAPTAHDAGGYPKIPWPPLKGPEPGEFQDPQQHRRQFQEQHQSGQPVPRSCAAFPHPSSFRSLHVSSVRMNAGRAHSGEIHVIVGPMFAGKTTALLRRIELESGNGRYDDTNREAEKKEYTNHIKEIVDWMGWKPFQILLILVITSKICTS